MLDDHEAPSPKGPSPESRGDGRQVQTPGCYCASDCAAGSPAPVRIVDARSHVKHLVPGDVLGAHRLSVVAKCGLAVVVASLIEPGHGRCRECAK